MTVEEVKSVFDNARKQGATDDDIARRLIQLFRDGTIESAEQLDALLSVMNMGLDKSFLAMTPEEQRAKIKEEDKAMAAKKDALPSPKEAVKAAVHNEPEKKEEPKADDKEDEKKAFKMMGLDSDEGK
jgi:hypothetical protein